MPAPHDTLHTEIKQRISAAYAETRKNLNMQLYGDLYPVEHLRPTWRQRWSTLTWRVHAAWLVLTGRADIC